MDTTDSAWKRWAEGDEVPAPVPGRRDLRYALIESVSDREYLRGIYLHVRTIRNFCVAIAVVWLAALVVSVLAWSLGSGF